MALPDDLGTSNAITTVDFTVGAETANVINVAMQLEFVSGSEVDEVAALWAWMSDNADGDGVAAAAASGGVSIGTDGTIILEPTTDKVFLLQSEADGDIDLDVDTTTSSEADTWYLAVLMPSGDVQVSPAITFA